MRFLGLHEPILWLNDVTFAPLLQVRGTCSIYDVTDDWLAAPFSTRELVRLNELERVALRDAGRVIVCSRLLAATRGTAREVSLIPNGVDVDHFRRPQPRPGDLPRSPVAVYVGTLHNSRLDIDLVVDVAKGFPDVCIAFVGPVALGADARKRLGSVPNVTLLGARPYSTVPAYLQHADLVIVPHLVSDFTESLDPIKAYECLAVDTPTVATPVAGFRSLAPSIAVASRDVFPEAVAQALLGGKKRPDTRAVPTWADRVEAFEAELLRVSQRSARA
jgi:glycosyltransferase involved in cell wall biosynthesis